MSTEEGGPIPRVQLAAAGAAMAERSPGAGRPMGVDAPEKTDAAGGPEPLGGIAGILGAKLAPYVLARLHQRRGRGHR